MKSDLPKLKPLELSLYIADLLLVSEGSEESVRHPKVRFAWHNLFFSTIILIILFTLINSIGLHFNKSESFALIYRSLIVVSYIYLIILLCMLAFRHYVYLLSTGKDLRFKQILFFYFVGVVLFAKLYNGLYFLNPGLYLYSDPIVAAEPTLVYIGHFKSYVVFIDFLVYSSSVIVSIDYPRIHSASQIISLLNVIQNLFGLTIIALFIATFVQKADQRRKD